MAITFGFYNSFNGDRQYNSKQMSEIFDGIINDGVFMSIGTTLTVEESSGMIVNVGIGRAWFDRTWTYNDSLLPLTIPQSEVVLNRIDAIVLEVDAREESRWNDIIVVKGIPASDPDPPELIREEKHNQYLLAHIYVDQGTTEIRQADITNHVGMGDTPFVTGILETMDISSLVAQWSDDWFIWSDEKKQEFLQWFAGVEDMLDENVAGHLYNMIEDLTSHLTTTLTTTWSGDGPYSKIQTIVGVRDNDIPIIDVVMDGNFEVDEGRIEAWGYIYRAVVTDENEITFYATEKPEVELPIQVKVVR